MSAGLFAQAINAVGQITVIPLFLHVWTKQAYGEWLILTAIPSLLWSIEGGLAGLAVNRMVLGTAVGNWPAANRLFQNIVAVQLVISAGIMLAGLLVAERLDIVHLLNIVEMSRATAQFVLVTMLFYMVLGWGVGLMKAPYFAAQRSVRGVWMWALWRLFDLLAIFAALLLHLSARGVALAETANAAAWLILGIYDVRRTCGNFRFSFSEVSWKESRTVLRDGLPLLLNQAGNAFFLQGYPLVIGRVLGPIMIVNFTAARTLSRVMLQGITMMNNSLSVELSGSYAKKNWNLYIRLVAIMLAFVLMGSAFTCAGLAAFGPATVHFWTHGKVTLGAQILLLFGISVSLQGAWSIGTTMLTSTNKHHRQCITYFVITLLALAVCAATVGRFGLVGVPVIMIIADVAILLSTVLLTVRALPEVPTQLARLLRTAPSCVAAAFKARVLSSSPPLATLGTPGPVSNNPPPS